MQMLNPYLPLSSAVCPWRIEIPTDVVVVSPIRNSNLSANNAISDRQPPILNPRPNCHISGLVMLNSKPWLSISKLMQQEFSAKSVASHLHNEVCSIILPNVRGTYVNGSFAVFAINHLKLKKH